ncbi:serine protease snake-like [Odontomachus brunneus]|uniref:serine protease snake-like n=1 Tax=Odontomachus brunneus TaxID=486640 RepID=UPI0013F1EFC1|nr:serine protease snake-like [Odontomachus brunneus]
MLWKTHTFLITEKSKIVLLNGLTQKTDHSFVVEFNFYQKKCAENAEAVFGLELPQTLVLDRTPVNVSRCALKTRKLIVGGKKAEPKEFPHMTAIGYDDGENSIRWLCGGSLISDRVILTAAHCSYSTELGDAKWARVGDLNLAQTNDDAQPQTIRIIERISHPDYKRPSEYHDIAIMKLETSVTYNAWVRPACLPIDLPDIGYDGKAVATGWGRVDWAEEEGSDNLLKVTLSLVSHASCNESFFDGDNAQLALGIVDKWQICAGELGKDTCQGDSGGPLTIFNMIHECMYNVIGVTSVGRLCGSIIPGVYTRVYNYIPWIERAAWPEYFKKN